MTATLDHDAPTEEPLEPLRVATDDGLDTPPPAPPPPDDELVDVPIRPLLVAALATTGAALMVGGIFGSWAARALGVLAGVGGVGWVWLTLRSPRRRPLLQALLPVAILGLGIISVGGGAADLPHLMAEAIKSGRLLRPPIPFDAGWRPIIIGVLALVGYAAGWVGAALDRPQTALVVPLPLLGLAAITQPKSDQLLAGIFAVVPLVAALTVVFGGDASETKELSRQFELRRALRAVAAMVPAVLILVLFNSTTILFPKPAYDPAQKPQKPKAVALSAAQDRVLFEVDGGITGPWQMGVLDVYDGRTWRLPPFDPKKLQRVPADGVVDKTRRGDTTVKFTVRDLGTSAVRPGVVGPTAINLSGQHVLFDPRSGTFREPTGRVPAGATYTMSLPHYPAATDLRAAPALTDHLDKDLTAIPEAPPAVKTLLAQAPDNRWDRLDFVLKKLNEVEIAVGEGTPVDVPPSKVQDLLAGDHKGSPYELVAAQAMLARWAGVPSRIGFGFDGDQQEGKVLTVRPKNAAQWLEVYFQGYGWIPIITAPPKAQASLDTNKNQKFNPTILASSDVAVEVYIPVRVNSLRLLYQQVRALLLFLLPFFLLLVAGYLLTPWAKRSWRRYKRRRWAVSRGPAAQVAVEYAEFRDLATDFGLGDPRASPLEYLAHVQDDEQHQELAWLVSRCLYGDLAGRAGPEEVAAGRELSESLRRRLSRGQPTQSRVLAFVSRASLHDPYTTEVPTVRNFEVLRAGGLRIRRPVPAGRS